MKTKIIAFILLCIPILTIGQTPNVQKLIHGTPCDTCFVKSYMFGSNILPHILIGAYPNLNRLSEKLSTFKESIKQEKFQQDCYLTTDSTFNLVFLTQSDDNYDSSIGFKWTKNYNYKNIEILIEKNHKLLTDWQNLQKLPPVEGYKINRTTWDKKTQEEQVGSWSSTHQTGEQSLNNNDEITITLRKMGSKEIIRKLHIKRILDKPYHFVYYQTSVNKSQFKESLQSFLNNPVASEYTRRSDTINSFELNRNNIAVLLFNGLEDGEEVEYTLDKNKNWKSIRKGKQSAFENKFIILDNEDIPPGKTKTLYLRYKNQPETETNISIQGIEDLTQTPLFKIIAGFMLASLLFAIFYFFNRRKNKKRLEQLARKNETIEAQLFLLSSQLNPHFLFNSLNAIQGTIMKENAEAANAHISDIASFMRRVMDDGKKEFISLQEEINIEEDYLKLEQKIKAFSYQFITCPTLVLSEIDFPPLLLQPILENSIRHGISPTLLNPNIQVEIKKENKDLIIKISDNGLYWNMDSLHKRQGLSLVEKRIALYSEKIIFSDILMKITYSEGTMTTFTFKNWLT